MVDDQLGPWDILCRQHRGSGARWGAGRSDMTAMLSYGAIGGFGAIGVLDSEVCRTQGRFSGVLKPR